MTLRSNSTRSFSWQRTKRTQL